MQSITTAPILYSTQPAGPCTFSKEPLLPTARQLRQKWNQRIQLLGNGVALFDQPDGSHRAINHTMVIGQIARIHQRKLPPFKVNKWLELGVIAQSTAHALHLPSFIGAR